MIVVTGDVHGNPTERLNPLLNRVRSGKLHMDADDYVIIAGDFGVLWKDRPDQRELSYLNWLAKCPWTTLVLDGNHENHDRFDKLKQIGFHGGRVGLIDPVRHKTLHLRRGEIYNLGDKTVFTFGGAASVDKPYRQEGISWWPRELPSKEEEDHALENLEKHGNKVDIIVTHTMPLCAIEEFRATNPRSHSLESLVKRAADPVPKFLQHIYETVEFKAWVCGHFHVNQMFCDNRIMCLFGDVTRLEEVEVEDDQTVDG